MIPSRSIRSTRVSLCKLCKFALAFATVGCVSIAAPSAHAGASISRTAFLFGLGSSTTTSAEEAGGIAAEAPFGFSFSIDHRWQDSLFIHAEHMRSFGDGSTSVGLTGAGVKYYPWVSPQHFTQVDGDSVESSKIGLGGWAYFFGASAGFAQSSVPATADIPAAIAVSFYGSVKMGMETPFTSRFGLRSEFNYAMSFSGSGSVQYFNLVAGFTYNL